MSRQHILPFLLILAAGMGVGSIHNAQSRGGIPDPDSGFGFTLIFATFIIFVIGFVVWRYYDGHKGVGKALALGGAVLAMVLELANLFSTLAAEGNLNGWLFHEYLGLVVSILLVIQIMLVSPVSQKTA